MKKTASQASRPRLLVITGLSGSGKSSAANALEDIGYYCVDNLPLPLLRTFLADPLALVGGQRRIAVVADVRAPGFAEAIPELLGEIDRQRYELVVIFLEATEDALIRRFSATRRSHPLAVGDRPLIEGIRRERALLADLRGAADLVFDTSDWSVHDCRREIYREVAGEEEWQGAMVVSLVSFGFSYGIPLGSDLLFDVRFLTNPHFDPELRELTGCDEAVREFLDRQEDFGELMRRLEEFLLFLLPRYRQENRCYLSVAVGCTGGRHRSVAVCEHLARELTARGEKVLLNHRDVARP